MESEEKDGRQPRPRSENPQGGDEERKPAYHATREGDGYQGKGGDSHSATGRRPRIKDSRNADYNRASYGRPQADKPFFRPTGDRMRNSEGSSSERRPYTPRYSQDNEGGERRPYTPRYPQQGGNEGAERRPYTPRYSQDNEGGERRPYTPRYSQQGGNEGGERRPYTPRYSQDNEGGDRRPYTPRYSQGGGDRRSSYSRPGGSNPRYSRSNDQRGGGGGYGNRPSSGGYQRKPFRKPYDPNAKYSVQKQIKYKEALTDPNEPIRLNKYLANAGVCSRREADNFILAGVVKVNGAVITELGTKITRQDQVMFHDQPVHIESKIYILLNKPKNCMTTVGDPQHRKTVMDFVKNACQERIYPVGRLDRNTTGVLLLTNDGALASKLTHPSFKKKKIYHVWLDKDVTMEDMEKLANGLELEDGEIHADAISYANEEDRSQVGIEIHSGRNRIVRRMFESLGYHVIKLDRVYFAGLTKKDLPRGKWRYLNEKEVNALRMGAFE